MHISQKLDKAKDASHRFESTLILLSAVGFISMASIYLLLI